MSLRLAAVLVILAAGAVLSCGAVQAQSDSAVLMTVDGLPVTRGDWERQNENFEALIACTESRGQLSAGDRAIEAAPRDLVLAAAFTVTLSTEAEAQRRGLAFSDEEIEGLVAEGRAAFEGLEASGDPLPCGVEQVARAIEEHGAREYWARIAPKEYRQGLGSVLLAQEGNAPNQVDLALDASLKFYGELRDRGVTEHAAKEFLETLLSGQ